MVSNGGDNAEDKLVDGATAIANDEGESHHSRDDLVEYLGTIRKRMRKNLPPFPI